MQYPRHCCPQPLKIFLQYFFNRKKRPFSYFPPTKIVKSFNISSNDHIHPIKEKKYLYFSSFLLKKIPWRLRETAVCMPTGIPPFFLPMGQALPGCHLQRPGMVRSIQLPSAQGQRESCHGITAAVKVKHLCLGIRPSVPLFFFFPFRRKTPGWKVFSGVLGNLLKWC